MSNHSNVFPKTSEFHRNLFNHQIPMTCEGERFIEIPVHDWRLGSVLLHLSRKFIISKNHGYIPTMSRKKLIQIKAIHVFSRKNQTVLIIIMPTLVTRILFHILILNYFHHSIFQCGLIF
ncbi:hypothetical protein TRFO_10822 [Tritrichomonas foetus]|uniref:Uncharacterized protein n=1 Tax=Tritrichomonas foetus TaxID=1144522 RepID=A0A1J4JC98_9EUKA|nr:hypothetical protein TRFO_10822 [Tritrichomonas foetus]|eukprot:OHS94884.1 hypothetical protein TRFO_10822 [Tritrichomonas foetus]